MFIVQNIMLYISFSIKFCFYLVFFLIFVRMKCSTAYQYVEDKIGGVFARYGRFVAAHAWKVLIFSVVINAGLGIGIMYLEIDNDARNYLPSGGYTDFTAHQYLVSISFYLVCIEEKIIVFAVVVIGVQKL